jgi:putative ABC transport system permease protein
MNTVTRGVRNAFRNGIRAGSIIVILGLVVGLSLSMLVARQAVEAKIVSVRSSIGNVITVTPAGVRGFEGGGEPLTDAQMAKVTALAHVKDITKTLSDRLQTSDTNLVSSIDAGSLGRRFNRGLSLDTNGGTMAFPGGGSSGGQQRIFTPPITVIGTNDSTSLAQTGSVSLTSGGQINAESTNYEALIGSGLATKNNLTVGSTFTAYGQTITIKGIIDSSSNRFAGNLVVLPLATVQKLTTQSGYITSASVRVDSIDNVASVVKSIENTLGSSADVVSQTDTANQALAPLESIKTVALYAVIGSAVAASVVILLTMVMIVRERRREIGALKAIGASDSQVTAQFVVESVTITTLASVLGVVVAVFVASPLTQVLVSNVSSNDSPAGGQMLGRAGGGFAGGFRAIASGGLRNVTDVAAQVDWHLALYGFGAALIIAIVGSSVAGWMASHVRPSEAIRAE